MPGADQTPELALRYLGELSADIRAALVVAPNGAATFSEGIEEPDRERMRELVESLFARAESVSTTGVSQVEVATGGGVVFAVRGGGFTIAAITGLYALPSLTFYDLRHVLSDLGARAA